MVTKKVYIEITSVWDVTDKELEEAIGSIVGVKTIDISEG